MYIFPKFPQKAKSHPFRKTFKSKIKTELMTSFDIGFCSCFWEEYAIKSWRQLLIHNAVEKLCGNMFEKPERSTNAKNEITLSHRV